MQLLLPSPAHGISKRHALRARASASGPSFLHRALVGLGGAVIGAWVGYFFSEVSHGDWQHASGLTGRWPWVGVGGAGGFALGLSLHVGGGQRVSGPLPAVAPPPSMPSGRAVLTAKEISASGASTAYEAVQDLRPGWLNRHESHFGQTQQQSSIPVYLNDQFLGDLSDLKTISAADVKVMYRYTVEQATLMWGSQPSGGWGSPSQGEGAIQVITRG